MDGFYASVRYSDEPYIRLTLIAPHRRTKVAMPRPDGIVIDDNYYANGGKRKSYRLTGPVVNESVRQVSNSVTVEEIGAALAFYVELAKQFRITA